MLQCKNLERIWPNYPQGKQMHQKELKFTKDLTPKPNAIFSSTY